MMTRRSLALGGAALSLALGVAACGGGTTQEAPAMAPAPSAPQAGSWDDPKAPRGAGQSMAGASGVAMDDDWDDEDEDDEDDEDDDEE